METPQVLVVDDHEVVRKGLISLFAGSPLKVCGEAGTAEEAIRLVRKFRPNVVLLDVRLGDADGLDSVRHIRSAAPQARVVMLSAFDNPTYVARAVAAGAHDYLLKTTSRADLIAAVSAAAAGETASMKGELRRVASHMAHREKSNAAGIELTGRETQVLRLIAMGLANQEIAEALMISIETVKEHVQNLLRKLSLGDRTQAAVWGLRHGVG